MYVIFDVVFDPLLSLHVCCCVCSNCHILIMHFSLLLSLNGRYREYCFDYCILLLLFSVVWIDTSGAQLTWSTRRNTAKVKQNRMYDG